MQTSAWLGLAVILGAAGGIVAAAVAGGGAAVARAGAMVCADVRPD